MRAVALVAAALAAAGCVKHARFDRTPVFAPANPPADYSVAYVYAIEDGVRAVITCGFRRFELYGHTYAALYLKPGSYTCAVTSPEPRTFRITVAAGQSAYVRFTSATAPSLMVDAATGAAEIAGTHRAPGGRPRIADNE